MDRREPHEQLIGRLKSVTLPRNKRRVLALVHGCSLVYKQQNEDLHSRVANQNEGSRHVQGSSYDEDQEEVLGVGSPLLDVSEVDAPTVELHLVEESVMSGHKESRVGEEHKHEQSNSQGLQAAYPRSERTLGVEEEEHDCKFDVSLDEEHK